MKHVARVALVTMCMPLAVAAQAPGVDELRQRAGAYVEDFIGKFSTVVSEERFLQESSGLPSVSGSGTNQKFDVPTPGRREIQSDFLFVRRQASDDWITFRDAFEVDGRAVRDRGDRLVKLLATPTLDNQALARKLVLESSRYNLDPGLRSVNDPILALVFLQPKYQPRFRFTRGARDRKAGEDVWIVNYQEVERPTLIRTIGGANGNGDAPARGRVWIDRGTGRVLRSEVSVNTSHIETTFAWDEGLQVAVPVEMRDSYNTGRIGYRVTASYSRFRRFGVSTTEQIGAAPQ